MKAFLPPFILVSASLSLQSNVFDVKEVRGPFGFLTSMMGLSIALLV